MQHVPGPVDDGLEQLVPRPGGRRQPGDLVQEAQLFELVVRVRLRGARGVADPARGQDVDADPTLVTGITIQA